MLNSAKTDGYLINTNRVLFVYTEVLSKRPDMRRATKEEIDTILGAKSPSVVADIEPTEITDEQVKDYATLHGIENDKDAINDFCMSRHNTLINKSRTTYNMIREVMKLDD